MSLSPRRIPYRKIIRRGEHESRVRPAGEYAQDTADGYRAVDYDKVEPFPKRAIERLYVPRPYAVYVPELRAGKQIKVFADIVLYYGLVQLAEAGDDVAEIKKDAVLHAEIDVRIAPSDVHVYNEYLKSSERSCCAQIDSKSSLAGAAAPGAR